VQAKSGVTESIAMVRTGSSAGYWNSWPSALSMLPLALWGPLGELLSVVGAEELAVGLLGSVGALALALPLALAPLTGLAQPARPISSPAAISLKS
jgi:hypothetical protein